MAAEDWTEKYRPETLKDIVGNPSSAAAMKQWAEAWQKGIPKYRALVLSGSPGIGKTSSAMALAREMGWSIVEMNASDQRTGAIIEDVAVRASRFNTFAEDGSFHSTNDGEMKLIILDEADSLYGVHDRGAMPVIINLVKNTRQPVILICNDYYELTRKSASIKTETQQVVFRKPQQRSIETMLKKISAKERVAIEEEAVRLIAENSEGDLRAAIRDLQSLALGNRMVTVDMAEKLSQRESRSDMYEFLGALFRKRNAQLAKQILRECDVDPPTVSLWILENIPRECANKKEMADCLDALSRADVFLGRVSKRMYYGLWKYASDMMVEGVVNALKTPKNSFDRFMFPSYLSKMSRSRATRAQRKALSMKLGSLVHTSGNTVLNESFGFFKQLATDDEEFRVFLIKEAGLEEGELAFLLGVKSDDKIVKSSFKLAYPPAPKVAKKKAEKPGKAEPAEFKMPERKTETVPGKAPSKPVEAPKEVKAEPKTPAPKQRSLFDF